MCIKKYFFFQSFSPLIPATDSQSQHKGLANRIKPIIRPILDGWLLWSGLLTHLTNLFFTHNVCVECVYNRIEALGNITLSLTSEFQRIVKMYQIPNIFIFKDNTNTKYWIIRFLKIDQILNTNSTIRTQLFEYRILNNEYWKLTDAHCH